LFVAHNKYVRIFEPYQSGFIPAKVHNISQVTAKCGSSILDIKIEFATATPHDYKVFLFAVGQAVGWGIAVEAGRSRFRFPMVSLEFLIDIVLAAAL
jgi:hypothetical protein